MTLDIKSDIAAAIKKGAPVVALESTVITHGLPYPENVETGRKQEAIVRGEGAHPATIAVISGRIKIGLSDDEIENIGQAKNPLKLNAADVPLAVAQKQTGGTTVAGTMFCADKAGIRIFATGGIGGVHRNVTDTWDISQDLEAFARYNVTVVTAGAKAILDLPKTLEYLETKAVPVIGYGTNNLPAFWTRGSSLPLSWRIDSPAEAAKIMAERESLGTKGGMVIANPVPEKLSLPVVEMEAVIEQALAETEKNNITGKKVTPYLLRRVRELTEGKSIAPNISILENNARLAAQIAVAFSKP